MMITEKADGSSHLVMDWLSHKFHGLDIEVIDGDEGMLRFFEIRDLAHPLEEARSVWLRRGFLPKLEVPHPKAAPEARVVQQYVLHLAERVPHSLGSLNKELNNNKLTCSA